MNVWHGLVNGVIIGAFVWFIFRYNVIEKLQRKKETTEEVKIETLTDADKQLLDGILKEYMHDLAIDLKINHSEFIKLIPGSTRPYGHLYDY